MLKKLKKNKRFITFRSNAWIDATGRRDLLTKGTDYAYKNCRVCALHFLEDMFANELKNRLHSHAVPKILLSPAEIHAAAAAANPTENESNEDTSTSTQSTEFELTNPNTTIEQKPASTNPVSINQYHTSYPEILRISPPNERWSAINFSQNLLQIF